MVTSTPGQKRIRDQRHDSYGRRRKLRENTRCSRCGALFTAGRWTWKEAVSPACETICSACRRIADHCPAGIIRLEGAFFLEHRPEILRMIRNIEEAEMLDHPMERIMTMECHDGEGLITTTGIHLANRLGRALKDAFQGEMKLDYGDDQFSLRVSWRR